MKTTMTVVEVTITTESDEPLDDFERSFILHTVEEFGVDALQARLRLKGLAVKVVGSNVVIPTSDIERDARRYRLLRSLHHQTGKFSVVQDPRNNVKLGAYLPYESLLDAELDLILEEQDDAP